MLLTPLTRGDDAVQTRLCKDGMCTVSMDRLGVGLGVRHGADGTGGWDGSALHCIARRRYCWGIHVPLVSVPGLMCVLVLLGV